MKHARLVVASLMLVGLAGTARGEEAASAKPLFVYDVQIVSNGAVVGTVRLPRMAVTTITADHASGSALDQSFVYIGHAVLTARVDGREVITLQGDQLSMIARRE